MAQSERVHNKAALKNWVKISKCHFYQNDFSGFFVANFKHLDNLFEVLLIMIL